MNCFWGTVQLLGAVGVLSLASCADDSLERKSDELSGVRVSFVVSDVQQDALAQDQALVRGVNSGVSADDLSPRRLSVEGETDASLVETTVEGINPVLPSAAVRGNAVTSIASHFSTMGYRSTSAGFNMAGASAWFHNKDTRPDGTLVESMLWSWHQPYARFYAVWPKVEASNTKLRLSDALHVGTPYVDFEVSEAVREQRDLLTASSGQVHYAVQGQTPEIPLRFRHALTAVRFAVGQNLSWNKTISKVEIVNAFSKGRYMLADEANGDGVWSDLSERKTFVLDGINVSTSGMVNHVLTGNDGDNFTFFMLPQTLTGNNVKAKIYFSDNTSFTVSLVGHWLAGRTKTYTLSQKTTDWTYVLTTESSAAAFDATTTGFNITSYRQAPDGTRHAVGWKLVGYDANDDGVFKMSEKPNWVADLAANGNGSATGAAERVTVTLRPDVLRDRLAEINQGLKDAPVRGSAGAPYNLANQTDGGDVIENTANCYVISAPGHYRLPLVYGNAIKNGVDNQQAYYYEGDDESVLRHFQDHEGNSLWSPYISVQHLEPPINSDVVWADAYDLVSNLSIQGERENAFLTFEVKRENLVNGNAVVSVKNSDGVIMWSWHLWFAPQSVLNTIPVTNHQGKVYNFTEEPLGMKYTYWHGTSYDTPRRVKVKVELEVANNGAKKYAVFEVAQNGSVVKNGTITMYQFGRKDALPGAAEVVEGYFVNGDFNWGGYDHMTFMNSIQAPHLFFVWGSSWISDAGAYGLKYNHKNLWSARNNTYGSNDNPVIKTVYDPCPVGFSMPASNAFTGFTTTGEYEYIANKINGRLDAERGWSFYTNSSKTNTIFFPFSSFRNQDNGRFIEDHDKQGFYWSALPADEYNGGHLTFSSHDVATKNQSQTASGYGVRPVSE